MPIYSLGNTLNRPTSSLSSVWLSPLGVNFPQAAVANTIYLSLVAIDAPCTLTGVQLRNDTPVSGNVLVSLYNAAGTVLLASSGSTAQAGAFSVQLVPFSAAYAASPGSYLLGSQIDNTTGHLQTHTPLGPSVTAAQGGFVVPSTVTPPSASARATGVPIMATY